MIKRIVLYADDGMILTDGETYGKIVALAIDKDEDDFYEITNGEYEEILKEKEKEED